MFLWDLCEPQCPLKIKYEVVWHFKMKATLENNQVGGHVEWHFNSLWRRLYILVECMKKMCFSRCGKDESKSNVKLSWMPFQESKNIECQLECHLKNQFNWVKSWNLISKLKASWIWIWIMILDVKVIGCKLHCRIKIKNKFECQSNIQILVGCHLKFKPYLNAKANTKGKWMSSWMLGQGTLWLHNQCKLNVKFNGISRFKSTMATHM